MNAHIGPVELRMAVAVEEEPVARTDTVAGEEEVLLTLRTRMLAAEVAVHRMAVAGEGRRMAAEREHRLCDRTEAGTASAT